MYRFAAIVWDEEVPERSRLAESLLQQISAKSRSLQVCLKYNGLCVLEAGARHGKSQTYPIADRSGVVVGKLFSKGDGVTSTALDAEIDLRQAKEIVRSKGMHLVENYWGRYAAFIVDKDSGTKYVLNSPASGFMLNFTSVDGVSLYFSHLGDVLGVPNLRLSVNWQYLAATLLEREVVIEETGYNEISELLAGHCHTIRRGTLETKPYWRPDKFVREPWSLSVEESRARIRHVAEYCVGAWAGTYRRIVHNLSGGFDSALVLACLSKAPSRPELLCVNYYTSEAEGDERRFAELAASKAGCPLIAFEMPTSDRLRELVDAFPHTVVPTALLFGLPTYSRQAELAREFGADAFMSGEGGDHLFYRSVTPAVAADFARDRGFLDKSFLRTALEVARMTKESYWTVLGHALLGGVLGRSRPNQVTSDAAKTFIRPDICEAVRSGYVVHPWEGYSHGIPIGKKRQIISLSKALHRSEPFGRSEVADVIHPLLSQPLFEQCLRIPSYVLTNGGRERGLTRQAFADTIPEEINRRRTKGATTAHAANIFVENLPFVREFLLDGIVNDPRIIDSDKLENYLTVETLEDAGNVWIVGKLLVAEAWLRNGRSTEQSLAA